MDRPSLYLGISNLLCWWHQSTTHGQWTNVRWTTSLQGPFSNRRLVRNSKCNRRVTETAKMLLVYAIPCLEGREALIKKAVATAYHKSYDPRTGWNQDPHTPERCGWRGKKKLGSIVHQRGTLQHTSTWSPRLGCYMPPAWSSAQFLLEMHVNWWT